MVDELLDRKRKLVIATDNFLPRWDGIARFLSEMIPRLYKHYDIIVIAPDLGTYEDPHIKLVKIPLMKFIKVGDFPIPAFKRKIIASVVRDADVVFSQTIGPIGITAIKMAKRYKKTFSSIYTCNRMGVSASSHGFTPIKKVWSVTR